MHRGDWMGKRTKPQWRRMAADIEKKARLIYIDADPRFSDNIMSTADMNAIQKIMNKIKRKMR